tara:strand:+ start:707 stop:976 length:270 start_codon:yes stop_codon:yes gene_type:complete
MGLLKILLLFAVFYYISKYLIRLFFPLILKRVLKKYSKGFTTQTFDKEDLKRKEGEVTIDKINVKKNKSTYHDGEYTDFEEVNEKNSRK